MISIEHLGVFFLPNFPSRLYKALFGCTIVVHPTNSKLGKQTTQKLKTKRRLPNVDLSACITITPLIDQVCTWFIQQQKKLIDFSHISYLVSSRTFTLFGWRFSTRHYNFTTTFSNQRVVHEEKKKMQTETKQTANWFPVLGWKQTEEEKKTTRC